MILLLIFSFLAGFFTAVSPCILPVLPIILSSGAGQGRWRPLGVVTGLVVSFTFFTLFLTAIVHATGLSANVLRNGAIILVFCAGLITFFPSLTDWFASLTSHVANLGFATQLTTTQGFRGGFIFGIVLGLLWTPCAGPIFASITVLAAVQSVSVASFLVTLAYSVGTAIPMFFIAYGSGALLQSRFLIQHTQIIHKAFGLLMMVTALGMLLHWDIIVQQRVARFLPTVTIEDNSLVRKELEHLTGEKMNLEHMGKAPELVGISYWINSQPLTLAGLKGKVVLIDFWTYSCINCLRTLPYITKIYNAYKDKGLVIIGVHSPEFEFEKIPKNVEQACKQLGVTYPVALDNEFQTWRAYSNHYWPAHYLVDQEGVIRWNHYGEGAYDEMENAIRDLINMPLMTQVVQPSRTRPTTPEIYLGMYRAGNYSSEVNPQEGRNSNYSYEKPLSENQVGLKGSWLIEKESITPQSDNSYLDLNFLAQDVYLVLSGKSNKSVEVYLDGKKVKEFIVDTDKKYDIVTTDYGRHLLSLKVPQNVHAYAFTFGG